jgi:hypothetical protein
MRKSDEKKGPNFGDRDPQIFSSLHDQIVVWLFKKIEKDKTLAHKIAGAPPGKLQEVRIVLEAAIGSARYGGGNFIAGFADLKVTVVQQVKEKYREYEGGPEKTETYQKHTTGFVEVKSSMNIGETVRQINYYRTFESGRGRWTVCAPKFPHAAILASQDIDFLEYDGVEDF